MNDPSPCDTSSPRSTSNLDTNRADWHTCDPQDSQAYSPEGHPLREESTKLASLTVLSHLIGLSPSLLAASYLVFTMIALKIETAPISFCLTLSFLILLSHYSFIRLEFDRRLLHTIIEQQLSACSSTSLLDQTALMDRALRSIGLIKKLPAKRDWTSRSRGILKYLGLQYTGLIGLLCLLALILGGKI